MKEKKAITLKTLTKSNVWDIQENDVFRMWEAAEKDADLKDNMRRYTDIIKTAFDVEEIMVDRPEVISKYEARGFKVGSIKIDDENRKKYAIKKKAIMRVTDLSYENIKHISAAKLVSVLERNFGGGWESLSQSIQDIIETGFDISTTTLPQERLHKAGGLYEKKVADGCEVLEIPKGTWTEAIFVKEKEDVENEPLVPHGGFSEDEMEEIVVDDDENDSDSDESRKRRPQDDDDDSFDDDKLTEESYRTTYETNPEDLNYEAEEISDDEEF